MAETTLERGKDKPNPWKNTVLAGLANYIDAGSIVAGAAGLALWTELFGLSSGFVGLIGAFSSNAIWYSPHTPPSRFFVPAITAAGFHRLAWILTGFVAASALLGLLFAPSNAGKSLDEIQEEQTGGNGDGRRFVRDRPAAEAAKS